MTESKALTVADTVNRMEPEFARALPKHIPSERFTRIAVSAINGNPALLDPAVDKRALYAACMKAAQDGLVIDGREAALVMFGKVPQYMPMVAGVLKKMRNSGDIAGITYGIVYQNEYDQGKFEYIKGDEETLRHSPILFGDKGAMIGVYAVVTTKDGFKIREFMDMAQINKVRNVSRSKDNGPWKTWFEEMAVKTALRKVAKISPTSTDLDEFLKADSEIVDEPLVIEHTPAPSPETKPRQTRAKAVIEAKQQEVDEYYPDMNDPHIEDELPI